MKKQVALFAALIMAAGGLALSACKTQQGHVHSFTNWETVRAATCTEAGLRRRTCKAGDKTETEEIAPLGHDFNKDNACTRCTFSIPVSEGLAFLPDDGGLSVAIGTCSATEIYIPAYHEGQRVVSVHEEGFHYSPTEKDEEGRPIPPSLTSVYIPDGVTYIGKRAFYTVSALQSVSLPVTLKTIDDRAFYGCSSLETIAAPASLTHIGEFAFGGCSSLLVAPVTEHTVSVGAGAFMNCVGLTSVHFGAAGKTLGDSAFEGCTSLEQATVGFSVEELPASAFKDCVKLKNLSLPATLKSIGSSAICDCNVLQEIAFGGTMAAWGKIEKAVDWASTTLQDTMPMFYIRCTDGSLNRYGTEVY